MADNLKVTAKKDKLLSSFNEIILPFIKNIIKFLVIGASLLQ